jgi:phage gp36-like protein
MAFLIPSDFETQLRTSIKELLTVEDPNALQKAEAIAIDEMKQYLSARYDMSSVFPEVSLYNVSKNYNQGEVVYHKETTQTELEYKVYVSLVDSNQGNTVSDTNKWQARDPRNQFVKMLCIDILIYHKYASRNLRTTPQHRIDRYNEAIEWLVEAGNGKNNNALPSKAITERKVEFRWGGYSKESHRY